MGLAINAVDTEGATVLCCSIYLGLLPPVGSRDILGGSNIVGKSNLEGRKTVRTQRVFNNLVSSSGSIYKRRISYLNMSEGCATLTNYI